MANKDEFMIYATSKKIRHKVNDEWVETGIYIDCGNITKVQQAYQTTMGSNVTGLPGQPSENAFQMDIGLRLTCQYTFIRVTPDNPYDKYVDEDGIRVDSTRWSNGFWLYTMRKYVWDRWQMKTDGIRICYMPYDNTLFTSLGHSLTDPKLMVNAYVESFRHDYKHGSPSMIEGNFKVIIGGISRRDRPLKSIIYWANLNWFDKNVFPEDSTNIVYTTDVDEYLVLPYPDDWIAYAQSKGVTLPIDDKFRWCVNKDGNGIKYKVGDIINLEAQNVVNLYGCRDE